MKACLQWINSSVPEKINFYNSLMMLGINPKMKLGQADLINISAKDLQFRWTQTVFRQRLVVFPDLISDTAHLNANDHGINEPFQRGNK